MPDSIRALAASVPDDTLPLLSKAALIIEYTHASTRSFLKAHDQVQVSKSDGSDQVTEEEQDLLRAMLVFAAAGLDSLAKQLIRDALPCLVGLDERVRQGLETFVARQLRNENDGTSAAAGNKFLARVLVAASQQQQVIREYVDDLTGKSMQSPEEVMKAVYALGLDPASQKIDIQNLRPIFVIRNKIVHELDISFEASPRHRESRDRDRMVGYTNVLLEIGESLYLGVANKLNKSVTP